MCRKYLSLLFIFGLGALSNGCAVSDDTPTPQTSTPSLPANAITITTDNAQSLALMASSTANTALSVIGVETIELPGQLLVNKIIKNSLNTNNRTYDTVVGVTEAGNCPVSGTYSDTIESTPTSESGSNTYTNCNDGSFVIDGLFTYNSSWNNTTGDYTSNGGGNAEITFGATPFIISLTYSSSGNNFTNIYSDNFIVSISTTNIGILVETTQSFSGIYPGMASSGQIIVTGKNNTRLRVTLNSTTTAIVELDNGNGIFGLHSIISTI